MLCNSFINDLERVVSCPICRGHQIIQDDGKPSEEKKVQKILLHLVKGQ